MTRDDLRETLRLRREARGWSRAVAARNTGTLERRIFAWEHSGRGDFCSICEYLEALGCVVTVRREVDRS